MSSAVSFEYLSSLVNQPGGIAGLDGAGKLSPNVLPAGSVETYKGEFATVALLVAAFPSGSIADYAYVDATGSFWYWNAKLVAPTWVNQVITVALYGALTLLAKSAVPYIIIP